MSEMEQQQPEEIQPEQPQPEQPQEAAMTRGTSVAVAAGVLVIALLPLVFLGMRHTHSAQAAARGATQAAPPSPAEVAALEAAVRTNPNTPNRLNLSMAYINSGRPGLAETVLRDLVAADPGSVAGWNNLCVAQVQLQELKDAVDDCQRALALQPDFQLTKNNLSWAHAEVKSEMDALAQLETTAPGARNRDFYLAQGMHEMHLGNDDAAIQSWQKMLLMNSQDAVAANNIGTALMLSHQPQAAEGWFQKAAAWDPTMQIAKNNLAWAQGEEAKARH